MSILQIDQISLITIQNIYLYCYLMQKHIFKFFSSNFMHTKKYYLSIFIFVVDTKFSIKLQQKQSERKPENKHF